MKTRRLANTDLELTTIGLGTWAIGGSWEFGWGRQDEGDSIAAILEALDNGINWIDTAPIYGCGKSEEIIAKALKKCSKLPKIATKCGLLWNAKKEKFGCLDRKSIIEECDNSLRRLGIETIDLYQIHRPLDAQIEEAFEAMHACIKSGKVRYAGVSNFSIEQMLRVMKVGPLASLQPPYSMLHREIEAETLDFCVKNSIGVVVYSPMGRGLLTGKFSHKRLSELPLDDHRLKSPDFQPPCFDATLELVEELKKIAADNKITPAQLAISWTLRRKEVTAAIVGARRKGQIAETAAAADIELSTADIEAIENLLQKRNQKIKG